jgi:hypothetical protein
VLVLIAMKVNAAVRGHGPPGRRLLGLLGVPDDVYDARRRGLMAHVRILEAGVYGPGLQCVPRDQTVMAPDSQEVIGPAFVREPDAAFSCHPL